MRGLGSGKQQVGLEVRGQKISGRGNGTQNSRLPEHLGLDVLQRPLTPAQGPRQGSTLSRLSSAKQGSSLGPFLPIGTPSNVWRDIWLL